MTIPDEYEYKEGDKRIEDTKGWRLCYQCMNCLPTSQTQLEQYGMFLCVKFMKWHYRDDCLQYICTGFDMKRCFNCGKYRNICKMNPDIASTHSFCNAWKPKRTRKLSGETLMIGRKNLARASEDTLADEEEYLLSCIRKATDDNLQ